MNVVTFYRAGICPALDYAQRLLESWGYHFLPEPGAKVQYLLLPVPSFDGEGQIKDGGDLEALLRTLPKSVTVIGGNLNTPLLDNYKTMDLLQDADYVTGNAKITAHCALKLAMEQLPVILAGQRVLIIGWGRIGKCLSQLLKNMGAQVTVAARKEPDRSMLRALGYAAVDTADIDTRPYRVIYNTAPTMVCPDCPSSALKIDLASRPGLGGPDVLWARGLPRKMAPESSGALIAGCVVHILNKE